jgi:hypothetical protein
MLREAGPVLYCFMPLQSSRRIESLILGSGLPSWLPDLLVVRNPYTNGSYSASDKRTDACHLPDNLLRASEYGSVARTTEQISSLLPFASSTFSPNLRELFVPGVLIGTIVETSGELLNQRDDTISIADQTRNLKQLYESLLAPRDISIESMIRLLANQGHWKQLNAAYYDAAKKAFVTNARQSDIPKAIWEVMVKLISLLVSTVANRILFVMGQQTLRPCISPRSFARDPIWRHRCGSFWNQLPFYSQTNWEWSLSNDQCCSYKYVAFGS